MSMGSQKIQISDEQLWQAFRYVGAELSTGEAEAFEQQMLGDVSLCEAVAEATTLTLTVAASTQPRHLVVPLSATLSQNAGPVGRYRIVALTAAMCGCLALIVALSGFRHRTDDSADVDAQADATDAELLVAAWADNVGAQTDDEADYDDSIRRELAVPDWMLAAVTLSDLEAREHSDMPDDMELF